LKYDARNNSINVRYTALGPTGGSYDFDWSDTPLISQCGPALDNVPLQYNNTIQ